MVHFSQLLTDGTTPKRTDAESALESQARTIATDAHAEHTAAAWLRDAVEDTPLRLTDLAECGKGAWGGET